MASPENTVARAAPTTEQCGSCRFWLAVLEKEPADDGPGWGWCRRHPPVVSDHMARLAIPGPTFGNQVDPDDVATIDNVADASLFPATWRGKWCGEFRQHPTQETINE